MKKFIVLILFFSYTYPLGIKFFYNGSDAKITVVPTVRINQSLGNNTKEIILAPIINEIIHTIAIPLIKKYKQKNNIYLEIKNIQKDICDKEFYHKNISSLIDNTDEEIKKLYFEMYAELIASLKKELYFKLNAARKIV